MAEDTRITTLEHPIDVMFLIHKALSLEAARLEEMVRTFELGGSVQPVNLAFDAWAMQLVFHADQEDRYMTGPMPDFAPARDNEAEHADLASIIGGLSECLVAADSPGLSDRVKAAILALHEEQHTELLTRLEDVMAVLNDEIGRGQVIARTQRHLYQRIVALRVAQDDHFECEEEFVLPEVRQRFSPDQQLEIVQKLLIDEESEDSEWVLNWLNDNLNAQDRELLGQLIAKFAQPVGAK